MTEPPDDDASGVPTRTERTDSGGTEAGSGRTESGSGPTSSRTVTNRNIVPRHATVPPRAQTQDDGFDVVTPVRQQPGDVVDPAATGPARPRERFVGRDAEEDASAFDAPTQPLPMPPWKRERLKPEPGGPRRERAPTADRGILPIDRLPPPTAAHIIKRQPTERPAEPALETATPRVVTEDAYAAVEVAAAQSADASEPEAAPVGDDSPRPAAEPSPDAPGSAGSPAASPATDAAAIVDPARETIGEAARESTDPEVTRTTAEYPPVAAGRTSGAQRAIRDSGEQAVPRPVERESSSRTSSGEIHARAVQDRPPRAASQPPASRRAGTEPGYVEPRRRPDLRRAQSAPRVESREGDLLDRVLRVGTIVAVLGLGLAGLAQPASVLRGGIAWLGFLFFALAGWGTLVTRVARVGDVDFGLRAAWGTCGYLAVAGPLIAAGLFTRPVILTLLALGVAGFAWREATTPIASWQRVRDALVFVKTRPALGMLVIALVALACIHMLGAVAALDRNPWDDDLAYTPFVKRLLDVGNLIEPFSFRRLGAYGGQTALDVLAGARGSLANVQLIDQGLCFGLALLAIVGYARERGTHALWLALVALVVLALPNTAINTAAYWSGAVVFVALYRTLVREQWALVGVIGAAACTLRQNFIVTAVLFIAIALALRLIEHARAMPWREAWHAERRNVLVTAVAGLATILPWWIAAGLSSHTFLFPLVDGTWNHDLSLKPTVVTWIDELGELVTCCVDTAPIVIVPIVAIALIVVADRRLGRPLTALFAACTLGLVFLVHGFYGAGAFHLWRYAFGFAIALLAMFALEVGAADEARVRLVPLGRWILLGALLLQIVTSRSALPKQYAQTFGDIREAAAIDRHGDPAARLDRRHYAALQNAIPAGARVVVMLDDPAFLDYKRNPIANLDTPGFASPGSQLPAFRGAEPLRQYLVAEGYRYVLFVRSDRSRYFFRRDFWLWRIFNDYEVFQIMSAYTIDMIDSLAELASATTVLYDSDGLVALDLGAPLREASHRIVIGDEPTRRDAWVRDLAEHNGLHDAWSLNNRADIRFEDGIGSLVFVDEGADDPHWYDVTHPRGEPAKRGQATRPVQRRAHLRVRGASDMHLVVQAAIALNSTYTHPRLDVSLDGELIAAGIADDHGHNTIDVIVPRALLHDGWHDLYLVFSSFAGADDAVRDIRGARLESVEWLVP